MNLSVKTMILIRDVLISVGVVGIILAALWGYTGQFPDSPMVVVTSGSMMHLGNSPYGRIGSIDPGDLVLVKKISSRDDITTRGPEDSSETSHKTYGDYGDVIIYYPDGDEGKVPIIHRAICWVDVVNSNGDKTYTIEEYGIHNAKSVTIDDLKLKNYYPSHSGFITKGDNNPVPDQVPGGGISKEPVKVNWIVGKARGELPWFGLIKLMIMGNGAGYDGPDKVAIGGAVAPKDEWVCLGLSLAIIIGIPTGWDLYNYYKKKQRTKVI